MAIVRVQSNGKSLQKFTQLKVVNDSGGKLPKLPSKDCEGVH